MPRGTTAFLVPIVISRFPGEVAAGAARAESEL